MINFYDNILGTDKPEDPNGFLFNFTSNFRIIDNENGFFVEFHKLFKRSYKGHEKSMDIIINNNPLNIKDISNIELDDFKMNKLHKGHFSVNFYDNNSYDIFLKEYEVI